MLFTCPLAATLHKFDSSFALILVSVCGILFTSPIEDRLIKSGAYQVRVSYDSFGLRGTSYTMKRLTDVL